MVDGSKIAKLEIQAKQAMNWLFERRMVPYDWAKLLAAVHAKFDELKAQFPQKHDSDAIKEAIKILKESPRNHQTAKDVFTKISTASGTEFSEKSFFGSFKHPVTKEWQVLV